MKYIKSIYFQSSRNYSSRYHRFKSLITPATEESFKTSLNNILDDISKTKSYLCLPGVRDQITKVAEYNRTISNNPSSLIMLHSYDVLKETSNLSLDVKHPVFVLAWAIEMLHSYNGIMGDKETWSQLNKGASLIRTFVYDMLEENCERCKDTLQLFNKGFLYVALGSYLETHIKEKGKAEKFSDFSLKSYETLCEYKTAYNTFKLPYYTALHCTRKVDKLVYDTIKKIGSDLSKLYQMQVEYEDCFGKEFRCDGTDIQDGKCTWLAVTSLQRCTAAQRIVFNSCYGSTEPAHVERIKLLYEKLKIPQLYREEEGALCESIMQRAESIERAGVPLAMFTKLLDAMYQEKIC